MRTIDEDIKNQTFRTAYLLYGEEAYLKNQYKDKLKAALWQEGDTMNAAFYQGRSTNPKELIDVAETMPFFADHRLILVEDSGFFKSGAEDLAEYMEHIPQTTTFVFSETDVDKRSRMYKALKNNGRIVEFAAQNQELLTRWLLGRLRRENKNITKAAMQEFFDRVGLDMGTLDREMEKLICYCLDRDVIELADVEAVCPQAVTNRIFDMVGAIVECRRKDALEMYYDLLALKEPPMRILYLITRQFNQLMQVKELSAEGYSAKTIGERLKMAGFIVRNYMRQAEYFTLDKLKEALQDCVSMEEAVKTGRIQDVMSVELLLVKYSK